MGESKHVLIICVAVVLLVTTGSGIGWAQAAGSPAAQWTEAELAKGYVVFTHSTLVNLQPDYVPARKAVVGKVSCTLARGEYKSLQIGIHALAGDLRSVHLELESDLEARVYRPIDGETRELLSGYANPVPAWMHDSCLDESSEIASIEKGKTSFFWLTLHAKNDAVPGQHRGKIRIEPVGDPATELDLQVIVRPFALQRARIAYAPFFYVEYKGTALPKFAQTDEWIGAIFRDMAEHSCTSVIGLLGVPGAAIDFSTLPPPENRTFTMLLPVAKQVGLTSPDIPVVIMEHNMESPESEGGMTVEQKNEAMDWYEVERRKQGWPELVAYGWDEPGHPTRYPRLRSYFEPFRDVRMRVGNAMCANAAYGLGDVHDIWIVSGGQITPEMCAEARRLGAEVWTYICSPLSTLPLHERYYAGLYVWAYKLKGHTTWHHYAQGGYKLIWMREGDQRPMPVVGWETRREGIDDYRYLQMLEDCIAARPSNPLAVEAKRWLDGLRARVIAVSPFAVAPGEPLALDEYDQMREKAADYIRRLGPVPADRIAPITHARLKDEAKPFRGQPVQECIAGLADEEASVRRAAASALFEMGPEAAPAVPALVDLLDDAEVRMPALRALEAIGYESSPALPKLRALLKHPDGFVRQGAFYVLVAIGAPSVAVLSEAVQDEYAPGAEDAARALIRLGRAALPALPTLIKLLDGPTWESQSRALLAIKGIGPEAAPAVPHIIRNWQAGDMSKHVDWWIETFAAIGQGAVEAVPVLENFREQYGAQGAHPLYDADARVLWALYQIRRSPEDLSALVNLVGTEPKPNVALGLLENLGTRARDAAPQIQELIAQGDLSPDVKGRLEVVLGRFKGSSDELRTLVDLIATGQRPTAPAALALLESRGTRARDVAPEIRELIAQGDLSDDVKKRLEAVLDSFADWDWQ